MSNFSIKIDLSKLSGAGLTDLQGPSGVVRCVVLPVDANRIYVGQKGTYLNLCAFELKNPQYGATHSIKLSIPKSVRDSMTVAEAKAIPIIGDLKPLGEPSSDSSTH